MVTLLDKLAENVSRKFNVSKDEEIGCQNSWKTTIFYDSILERY